MLLLHDVLFVTFVTLFKLKDLLLIFISFGALCQVIVVVDDSLSHIVE